MKSFILISSLLLATVITLGIFHQTRSSTSEELPESSTLDFIDQTASLGDAFTDPYANWQRPAGPPRVALQVGHWKNQELPDEFRRLRETGGGASGGGKAEWEVNLAIAEATAELLRTEGVVVDLLPATIPPDYWADVLVSIHADGNENSAVHGYKVAAPRRDMTSNAETLASFIEEEYGKTTSLALDGNITRNMTGYYAFNWRRYDHTMHPMTAAAIVETGFLTSAQDRKTIVAQPELSAQGVANGIMLYLRSQEIS